MVNNKIMKDFHIKKDDYLSLTIFQKDINNEVTISIDDYGGHTTCDLTQDEIKEIIAFLQQQLIDKI
jgi:hypothetical protein